MLDKEAIEGGDALLGNGASIPVQYTGCQYTDIGIEGESEENTPVVEETVESDPSEIISIIDNIRSGKITYEQAVTIITVIIGYDESTARALLGNPEDYETPEEPIEEDQDDTGEESQEENSNEDDTEDNTEDDPEESEGEDTEENSDNS